MSLIMKLCDYVVIFLYLLSIGVAWTIIRGIAFKIMKKEDDEKDWFEYLKELAKKNILLYTLAFIFMIFATVISSREITFYLGWKDITMIPRGTYTYYIDMKKISSGKSYREPAVITKDGFCYDTGENSERCDTIYYVERVYFANGGYITFDDENEINLNDYSDVVDHKGNEYEMILLNKHTEIDGVIESHPSGMDLFFPIYLIVIELICWLYPLYLMSKREEKESR